MTFGPAFSVLHFPFSFLFWSSILVDPGDQSYDIRKPDCVYNKISCHGESAL